MVLRCYCIFGSEMEYRNLSTGIMVLWLLFANFQFWDGIQNSVPNMWQIVLSNVYVQGSIVLSNEYASLMPLAMLFPSLPMILKVSTVVMRPVTT